MPHDTPTAHNQTQPLLRLGEYRDIFQRVAIRDEQISVGSRPDNTYLSFEPEQPCCYQSCRAYHLDRRLHLATQGELIELILMHIAEQIRAEDYRDTGTLRQLQRPQPSIKDVEDLPIARL